MRMWISLALAVAVVTAAAVALLSQNQGAPRRLRHQGGESGRETPSGPTAPLPGSRTPSNWKPSSLDGKVVFKPLKLDGDRVGCRVELRTPENGLARAGLKEGDVIVEVEGKPMTIQVALALTQRLDEASLTGLDLTILRGGETQRLTVRIAQ